MRMIRWWRVGEPVPPKGVPFVAMNKSFDIPETVAACIRNAAPGMVAIALCRRGGRAMIGAAKDAAKERGIRILWWNGPQDMTTIPDARPDMKKLKEMTA